MGLETVALDLDKLGRKHIGLSLEIKAKHLRGRSSASVTSRLSVPPKVPGPVPHLSNTHGPAMLSPPTHKRLGAREAAGGDWKEDSSVPNARRWGGGRPHGAVRV